MENNTKEEILSINNLSVAFRMYSEGFQKRNLEVIHSLSLAVNRGEILAVVGSSGSGKSILASTVLGLLPKNAVTSGEILYRGEPVTKEVTKRCLGKEIAYVPQSVDFLDPLMKVGSQVTGIYGTEEKKDELFKKYKLLPSVSKMYPHELSGGMTRRILISGAVIGDPVLIIADEPTPGLDVEMAKETLRHFRSFADDGAAVMLITHDIDLAFEVADRIAVFYAGTIVEIAPTSDFITGKEALRHPYSKAFIDALPQNGFKPIAGAQPYAGNLPEGCLFSPRCDHCDEACTGSIPQMREIRGGFVRCVYAT